MQLKWRSFALASILIMSLFSRFVVSAGGGNDGNIRLNDEYEKWEKEKWNEFYSFDLEKAVAEAKKKLNEDSEKVCVTDPWRSDVRVELSDNVDSSEGVKKLKVFGLPEGIEPSWIRLWVFDRGFSMSGSSCFSDQLSARGSLKFNESENCYEYDFTPALDSKNYGCKNFVLPFSMKYFRYIVFLKNKYTGEPVDPVNGFVSNEGLKIPSHLDDFKNFKIDYIKNIEEGKAGLLKIYGIPADVSNIRVWVEECVEKGKLWEKVVDEENVTRGADGSFCVNCLLKSKDSILTIDFVDSEGYSYLICDGI